MAAGDGVSLADPTIPVDPETVSRALGAALRLRHDEPTDELASLSLVVVADAVAEAARPVAEVVVEDGPYLGRRIGELARLAVETVAALPSTTRPEAPLHARLDLKGCTLQADGTVLVPDAVARGDRELELAGAAVAVGSRFGPAVVAPLFEAYGMDELDLRRLDTSQLLVSLAAALGVDLAALP